MKSDLRNMLTAEEAYFAVSVYNDTGTTEIYTPPPHHALPSSTVGNSAGTITVGTGTASGWSVSITNIKTAKSCGIYVGAVTPTGPHPTADAEGEAVCRYARCRGNACTDRRRTAPFPLACRSAH